MTNDIQIHDCFIKPHANQIETMFTFNDDNSVVIRLKKMAIVPLDEYNELVALKESLEIKPQLVGDNEKDYTEEVVEHQLVHSKAPYIPAFGLPIPIHYGVDMAKDRDTTSIATFTPPHLTTNPKDCYGAFYDDEADQKDKISDRFDDAMRLIK